MLTQPLVSWMLLLVLVLMASSAAAQSLSGSVLSAVTGLPLSGIDIDVFDASGAAVAIDGTISGRIQTDVLGQYAAPLPGPGSYRLRADPTSAQGHAAMYYGGVGGAVALKSTAQVISVGVAQAVAGVDIALPAGVVVSGTVTASGFPAPGIDIDVFAMTGPGTGEFLSAYPGTSGVGGAYSVGALPPGQYFIRADPSPALGQYQVRTFYAGAMSRAGATPVVVGSLPVTAVDMDVPPGGTFSGVVTSVASGLPLAGLDLDIFDALGTSMEVTARTDAFGFYEIGALPAGLYTLRVDPTMAQGYARTYHPNAGSPAAAIPIAIQVGGPLPGIDFALETGGSLSGTIRTAVGATRLFGIDLDVFDANQRLTLHAATTDALGSYRLGPMKAGVYFVRADPSALQGYGRQYYAAAIALPFAAPVVVSGGVDTPGVDFSLEWGGSITGTLWDPQMSPALGVDLDLYDAVSGARLRKTARSSLVDGTYSLGALAPGSYKLRADATLSQGFALLYYDAKRSKAMADPVSVVGGAATPAIDFRLVAGGAIGGFVRSAATLLPVAGVRLDVFDANSLLMFDQGALTASDGSYTVVGLDPGDYLVKAVPGAGIPFAPAYYGGTPGPAGAAAVTVAAGAQTPAIDLALPEPEPALLRAVSLLVLVLLADRRAARLTRDQSAGRLSLPRRRSRRRGRAK